jgi:DNA-directed RNA polymerase subunit RPC12/RpoP
LDWYDKNRHYVLDLNMVHTYPGTPIYNNAVAFGIIPDKKQFLIDGCPVINISQLTDKEYKFLASEIYERNIMAKFEPVSYNGIVYQHNGRAKFSYDCVRCKDTFLIEDCDVIHNTRHRCNCGQRYYFELSNNIDWSEVIDYVCASVQNNSDIYLWGAGEVSIKIIDRLTQDARDRITILDSSKSRHGLTLRGLPIYPPDALHGGVEVAPKLVLVTVLTRKNEILKSLKDLGFKGEIIIPDLCFDRGSPRLRLKTCQNFGYDDLAYVEKSGEWVPWSGSKYIQAQESAVIGK